MKQKREQPEEKQIEKPAKPAKRKKEPEPVLAYEDEYIIALLAGANKQHKQQDLEKFSQLPAYLNELEWVKYANALKHAVIVGSGVNYLVLARLTARWKPVRSTSWNEMKSSNASSMNCWAYRKRYSLSMSSSANKSFKIQRTYAAGHIAGTCSCRIETEQHRGKT